MHWLSTLRGRMPRFAAAVLVLAFAMPAAAQTTPQEGRDYVRLKNPVPVETGKKIEVIEFFSYGCPHCADLEPILQNWMKTMPADVQLRRIPVMFQERWIPLARIYYTLEALGEEKRLSPAVFSALHSQGLSLWQDKTFFDWAASQGLDRKKVEDMYNSFAIAGKVNRARSAAGTYEIQSVPTFVVDGKLMTYKVASHQATPAALDAMIAKARAERPKS
jgi:thiol:disulfide interchange protein DsbA